MKFATISYKLEKMTPEQRQNCEQFIKTTFEKVHKEYDNTDKIISIDFESTGGFLSAIVTVDDNGDVKFFVACDMI